MSYSQAKYDDIPDPEASQSVIWFLCSEAVYHWEPEE